ncbi:MAG TPA: zinc-ribbon domain-containing protein [Pyrinomonadaceae bacterium]|nr:zinc-ribbon domain-containing protein [Pyrinomonadaceae bacterium]
MFCPKCGTQNPDEGVFCRSCGIRLSNATAPLGSTPTMQVERLVNRKGKPISYESAIAKICSGLAFIIIACILGYTGAAGGRGWWFWMLIPGFGSLGTGIAHWLTIRNAVKPGTPMVDSVYRENSISGGSGAGLPPAQQQWAAADSSYKTGDLVPPSVTDNTTRHLELDKEGRTMTLPKQ